MINTGCRDEDLPFNKECSNHWLVFNFEAVDSNKGWVIDDTVVMKCSRKGIVTYIMKFNTL